MGLQAFWVSFGVNVSSECVGLTVGGLFRLKREKCKVKTEHSHYLWFNGNMHFKMSVD